MKKVLIICSIATIIASCGKKEEAVQQPIVVKPNINLVNQVVGIASIEPVNRVLPITSETNGLVENINSPSGQEVKKGDVIFSLEHDVEEAQLAQAQSKLSTQNQLIGAQISSRESLKVKIANAKTTFDRNQKMLDGGAITQQALDDSRASYEGLQKDLITSDANIAQQQSRLRELQQDIKYAQTMLDRKYIRALANGTILNLDLKLGSIVTSNASVGDFASEGPYMALTEIDELYANKVQLGQSSYVRSQGAKDTLTLGKVIFVSPYLKKKSLFSDRPDNLEDRRVREVRVQLDDKSKVLIGSRVECVIVLK